MNTKTIKIPSELHRLLKIEAAKRKMAIKELATKAIRKELKREGDKE